MSTYMYTPGTKLSYASGTECCTVLTNGNSLVTKVWGDAWWEQMPLADWLVLADGQEQEDYIPLATNQKAEDDFSDLPPLVSMAQQDLNDFWTQLTQRSAELEAERKPAYPKRPIGTKLKWVSQDDEETYRIAVVTKHGVCQVKAITEGGGDCYYDDKVKKRYLTKRTFDSEASWRNALPEGGEVYVY
jgi:hypothetical protein